MQDKIHSSLKKKHKKRKKNINNLYSFSFLKSLLHKIQFIIKAISTLLNEMKNKHIPSTNLKSHASKLNVIEKFKRNVK